ncbi:MAG: DUF58 domain-containing protein [Candidatus Jordarchaeum sp.]|uniref:DUF58 domain-containing protein n=1 Tax=Candidatus Jordarchaeum sp. TaxID=2823881 RepID=UPI00404B31A8
MLTPRGAVFIVSGVFCLAFGFSTVNYYLVLLGIFLILGSVISMPYFELAVDLENIEITRTIDKEKVFAEDFVFVTVTVENKGKLRIDYLEIFDTYPEIFTLILGKSIMTTRLDPGEKKVFSYVLQCRRRGVHKIGPFKLVVHDRLGLHFEQKTFEIYTELLIYPSYQDVRKMEAMGGQRTLGRIFGMHKTKQKGMGTEFFGIRNYFPMDEYRRIDWKATARTGDLMMREFEIEKNIKIMVLLDTSASMGGGLPDNTKLDYSIRAAVLLAKLALERRDEVGIVAFSNKVHIYVKPRMGKEYFYHILEALAIVEPQGGLRIMEVMEWVLKRTPKRSFFVLLTDLEESRGELINACKLARAHKNSVLVISPFGPWFEAYPGELTPVQRALTEAISEELLEQRKKIIDELVRMDIGVIDVSPDDFLPAVVSQYLKAKKKGVALR